MSINEHLELRCDVEGEMGDFVGVSVEGACYARGRHHTLALMVGALNFLYDQEPDILIEALETFTEQKINGAKKDE